MKRFEFVRAYVLGRPAVWTAALVCFSLSHLPLDAKEETYDTLSIGGEVFTNATVLNVTKTDVFIQHANGLANVKIENLDPEVLKKLKDQRGVPVPEEKSSLPEQITTKITEQVAESPYAQAVQENWQPNMQLKLPPIPPGLIISVLAFTFLFYLFFCYCCMLIVQKTGNQAGLLVWIPGLQAIPLFRAAGMSGWCFILCLLPLVNIVVSIMWNFKIVEARGKHMIWAILLLLPMTNFIAFLYLAFSESAIQQPAYPEIPFAQAA